MELADIRGGSQEHGEILLSHLLFRAKKLLPRDFERIELHAVELARVVAKRLVALAAHPRDYVRDHALVFSEILLLPVEDILGERASHDLYHLVTSRSFCAMPVISDSLNL